jgi:hypothetical protein
MTEVVAIAIISLVVVRVIFLLGRIWRLVNAESYATTGSGGS